MLRSKTVLIADMDDNFRNLFATKLNVEDGLQLIGETNDGEELLSMISERSPDALVIGSVLENMDGLEVLDALASLEKKCPRIIFLSEFAGGIAQMAADKGADYFMVKPCRICTLIDRIRQLTDETSTEIASGAQYKKTIPDNSDFPGEMEATVTAVLLEIGVPANIIGYQYLRTAILMAINNMESVTCVTKQLYPVLAKRYKTTSERIERSMRHGIEVAWNRGKREVSQRYFGYTVTNNRPTNSEFIAMIADHIQIQRRFDAEKANSRLNKFYI